MPPDPEAAPGVLAQRLLDIVENEILPLTRAGIAAGNKVFGGAILRKDDLSLVVAGTNGETANPLLHGEIATLNAFYALDASRRPSSAECLFLATHEPCPLCLSAITWAGFDNFTYLFGYADTRDAFAIPHDLRILEEVFGIRDGAYRRDNSYWRARSVAELAAAAPAGEKAALEARIAGLAASYAALSKSYQAHKGAAGIPLP